MPASVKVGVLNDTADLSGDHDPSEDMTQWLEREVTAVIRARRLNAEVEFVHAYALGLPSGTAEAVERAYRQLADEGCVLIVGPATGDNALLATPLAERMRIATINCSDAERARGRWMFHHQSGSHADEALVMARHLARLGCQRIAVVHETSPAGTRYLKALEAEARALGLALVITHGLSGDPAEAVHAVLGAASDAVAYLGTAQNVSALTRALDIAGWDGARMMPRPGPHSPGGDLSRDCDGWFHINLHSDTNQTLARLLEGLDPRPPSLSAAKGHDLGRLVAEALARATDLSREGVRTALEHVRWLPAAEGHEGTLLGFGIQDRGALHGRYLVVRQWLGGESREVAAT